MVDLYSEGESHTEGEEYPYPDGELHPTPAVEPKPVFSMFEVLTPNNGKGDIWSGGIVCARVLTIAVPFLMSSLSRACLRAWLKKMPVPRTAGVACALFDVP